jgi:hypothetical protein
MQRLISQDDILILDGGNYIKGIQKSTVHIHYYRYNSWFIASSQGIGMNCIALQNLTKQHSAPYILTQAQKKLGAKIWNEKKLVSILKKSLMLW